MRFVIVNADDFGLSEGVNRGIGEAFERGIVTSTSLMVRYPAAKEAADYGRMHPELAVGLHFDVAEWHFRDGEWKPAYQVVDAKDATALAAELERQLAVFKQLLQRPPTHLDSHQHVHQSEPARSVLLERARQIDVPLRGCTPFIRYAGGFYGQTAEGAPFPEGISVAHLIEMLRLLEPGWTEVGCHPGYGAGLDSIYAAEREEELRVLCSLEIRSAIRTNDLQLRSFRDGRI